MTRTWMWALVMALLWAGPSAAALDADAKLKKAVLKPLKKAERAGAERHQLKRYLAAFTKDAVWTFGRRPVADSYDRVYDRAAWTEQARRMWSGPANGRSHIYFTNEAFAVEGDTATYEVQIRHDFFGGNRELGRRYELVRTGKRWLIKSLREWPRQERLGIEHTVFTDDHWLEADEAIEKDPQTNPLSRMMQFMTAYRYAEALDVMRAYTDAGVELTSQHWLARATLAVELNHFDEAADAVRKARALDPLCEAPIKMREAFPSAHHAAPK